MPSLTNIFWLGTKELRSFVHDYVLLGLVIWAFSFAVFAQVQSSSQKLHNAAIAIIDEDNSPLSHYITEGFYPPPYFNRPELINLRDVNRLMDNGSYTFILDIPLHFERDVLAGRQPAIQVNVDATVMVQAGIAVVTCQSRHPRRIQTQCNDLVVHEYHKRHQQRHDVGDHSFGRRRCP